MPGFSNTNMLPRFQHLMIQDHNINQIDIIKPNPNQTAGQSMIYPNQPNPSFKEWYLVNPIMGFKIMTSMHTI